MNTTTTAVNYDYKNVKFDLFIKYSMPLSYFVFGPYDYWNMVVLHNLGGDSAKLHSVIWSENVGLKGAVFSVM